MPRTSRAPRISEKSAQNDVVDNLLKLGFFVQDLSQPRATMLPSGLPDLHAAHGRWRVNLWIEMKAPDQRDKPNGGLSFDQLVWHMSARIAGLDVVTAYGWSDVERELRKRGVPLT